MIVHLFGLDVAAAADHLAGLDVSVCSWAGCTDRSVVGCALMAPHDPNVVLVSCACAGHRAALEASTVGTWQARSTDTQAR